ncbi:hypothetical protein [Mycobacterium colombiense]|uniref:hypothetical protein n=1 Tax=Mycobacterium colombiense TaxID=339268 RepID=UPI0011154E66|nr:hypothetical protein [Mycobacterium colombiense]
MTNSKRATPRTRHAAVKSAAANGFPLYVNWFADSAAPLKASSAQAQRKQLNLSPNVSGCPTP